MSDNTTSIVPRVSQIADSNAKAIEILKWLLERKIIKNGIQDEIARGVIYPIGEGAALAVLHPDRVPYNLILSYMQVIHERAVFPAIGAGENQKFDCPKCGFNISTNGFEFIDQWFSHHKEIIDCPNCKAAVDIQQVKAEPSWGFSNLGFTFWNWPEFTPEFLKEFRERLGCDLNVVQSHI